MNATIILDLMIIFHDILMSKTRAKLGKFLYPWFPFLGQPPIFILRRSTGQAWSKQPLVTLAMLKFQRRGGMRVRFPHTQHVSFNLTVLSFLHSLQLILSSTTLVQRLVRPTARFLAFQIGASAQHGDVVLSGSACGSFDCASMDCPTV